MFPEQVFPQQSWTNRFFVNLLYVRGKKKNIVWFLILQRSLFWKKRNIVWFLILQHSLPWKKNEHSLVSDVTTFSPLKKDEHSLISDFTTFSSLKKEEHSWFLILQRFLTTAATKKEKKIQGASEKDVERKKHDIERERTRESERKSERESAHVG